MGIDYKQEIEKIKRESCVPEIQEAVKDYTGEENEIELSEMLEKAQCRIIAYRINCLL